MILTAPTGRLGCFLRQPGALRMDETYPSILAPFGLTFDDVLLLPGYSEVNPSEAVTATRLSKRVSRLVTMPSRTPLLSTTGRPLSR